MAQFLFLRQRCVIVRIAENPRISFGKGRYSNDVHENYPIFQTPTTLVYLRSKFFHPLDLGCPILNEPPPLQMITNQLKENINQGWQLYVTRSFLQAGFRFRYQLINLVWLSFHFSSFSWSLTIWFFVDFYYGVCSCQKKPSWNVFYL